MNWTVQRVDHLKKLWNKGLSASQIAKELGNVTRNAVIGKVHRLRLSSRPSPIEKKAISFKGLSILDLTDDTCRWPFGDPQTNDFYYCGQPILAGFRYCEIHTICAYQWKRPATDRQTEPSS